MSTRVRVFKLPQGGLEPLVKLSLRPMRAGKPLGAERVYTLSLEQAAHLRTCLTKALRDMLGTGTG
jgi:hypothetical protein